MKFMRKYVSKYSISTFYQLEIWKAFGVNPFHCFKCNTRMKVKKISYFNIFAGKNIAK